MSHVAPLLPDHDQAALDERESAHYIDMSTAYLRLCRRENRGPAFVRVGRTVRYLRKDLDAWLTRHRVETRESFVHDNAPGRGNGPRA
jgi:predicted DNA-binding transcriptional regulator AlpA